MTKKNHDDKFYVNIAEKVARDPFNVNAKIAQEERMAHEKSMKEIEELK